MHGWVKETPELRVKAQEKNHLCNKRPGKKITKTRGESAIKKKNSDPAWHPFEERAGEKALKKQKKSGKDSKKNDPDGGHRGQTDHRLGTQKPITQGGTKGESGTKGGERNGKNDGCPL